MPHQVRVWPEASAPFPTYSPHSKASCPHAGVWSQRTPFPSVAPLDSQSGYLAASQAALSRAETMAGLRPLPASWLRSYKLGRSDLGPPAFDKLHDLLHLELGEVEVVSQDVLTELHKDTAINTFSSKEAHHVLREADETQTPRDLL